MKKKIIIIGSKDHGKDYMADLLVEALANTPYEVTFQPTSKIFCTTFCFEAMKDTFGYKEPLDCYADKDNQRPMLFQLVSLFNYHDKAAFIKYAFTLSDVYSGLRCILELSEARRQTAFDILLAVDAGERLPIEPITSFTIPLSEADKIFDNNGSKQEFKEQVYAFAEELIAGEWD